MMKITKKMLIEYIPHEYKIGTFQAYCDLHDCCECCNPKIRTLCKVKRTIEDLQKRIILKEVNKNE